MRACRQSCLSPARGGVRRVLAAVAVISGVFGLFPDPGSALARDTAPLTVLAPSQAVIEAPDSEAPDADKSADKTTGKGAARPPVRQQNGKRHSAVEAPAPAAQAGGAPATQAVVPSGHQPAESAEPDEVDVLIAMMRPPLRASSPYAGFDMEMPQLFAVLRHDADAAAASGGAQPERRDLLGDVEEIRYQDKRAWGANVALEKPGLYQFILEARPWWDEARQLYRRHLAKTEVPVRGVDRGWHLPAGLRFEIVPLSRPFGLSAPALFSGRLLRDGKPVADAPVRMVCINAEQGAAPSPWHEALAAVTNALGEFSFVLDRAGWWCCEAVGRDEPLRGPDGELRPVELDALFWFYVDGPAPEAREAQARKR